MKQAIIVIQSSEGLEQYYHHANNLLYLDYQNSPTSLIDIPVSAQEQGEIAYYNALASQLNPSIPDLQHTPIGKLVV